MDVHETLQSAKDQIYAISQSKPLAVFFDIVHLSNQTELATQYSEILKKCAMHENPKLGEDCFIFATTTDEDQRPARDAMMSKIGIEL
jgi:hypothetical protein